MSTPPELDAIVSIIMNVWDGVVSIFAFLSATLGLGEAWGSILALGTLGVITAGLFKAGGVVMKLLGILLLMLLAVGAAVTMGVLTG